MAEQSIMDKIHENVNPTSCSNAIYELMVDWRGMVMRLNLGMTKHRTRTKDRIRHTEAVLSRFFGCDPVAMRQLLEEHFDVRREGR